MKAPGLLGVITYDWNLIYQSDVTRYGKLIGNQFGMVNQLGN